MLKNEKMEVSKHKIENEWRKIKVYKNKKMEVNSENTNMKINNNKENN